MISDPRDFQEQEERSVEQILSYMLRAMQVRRFHTESMLQPPTVGAHSSGVARMCWLLTQGKASSYLLIAALTHDDGEVIMGDMPAPTKRLMREFHDKFDDMERNLLKKNVPWLVELTDEERRVLHLADCLQGALECVLERALGNKFMDRIFERFMQYAYELKITDQHEYSVRHAISKIWKEVTS